MEFEQFFVKSAGQPVQHKGESLYLYDELDVVDNHSVVLSIESTNSKWKQGVIILFPQEISFRIDGTNHIGEKTIFWENTAPKGVKISWSDKISFIKVYNTWEVNGQYYSLHNGSAMKKIDKGDTILYRCNDGYPDEDFDDLIFSLCLF